MADYLLTDETLPDEFLREIGGVVFEWSKLELGLDVLLWQLLFCEDEASPWQHEQRGRAVTTHLALLLRCDMLLSLSRERLIMGLSRSFSHPLELQVENFVADVRTLNPKRNQIVHGTWSRMQGRAFRQIYRARGEVTPIFDILTVEDIRAVADQVKTAAKTANRIINEMLPWFASIRQIREFEYRQHLAHLERTKRDRP